MDSAIRKKTLSEEEIADVYEQFGAKKKMLTKRAKIIVIIFAILALFFGISTYVSTDETGLALITGILLMVIGCITAYFAVYCNIGKVAKQWNSLIKSYYSDISDKYTL